MGGRTKLPQDQWPDSKSCNECGLVCPLEDFYRVAKGLYGRKGKCKSCENAITQRSRAASDKKPGNKEKRKASDRARYYANHEEVKAKGREYYRRNIEARLANGARFRAANPTYGRDHYQANREEILARHARWRLDNPDYHADWWKANPDKANAYRHKRRALLIANSAEHYTDQEWLALLEICDYACLCCGRKTGELDVNGKIIKRLTVDHIVPISKLGSNDIGNLQPLCTPCNSTKNNQIIDYRETVI